MARSLRASRNCSAKACDSVTAASARRVAEAYARWGKGVHPASLNYGDCFAYACAKANDARLLYKGNDFVHTDLA